MPKYNLSVDFETETDYNDVPFEWLKKEVVKNITSLFIHNYITNPKINSDSVRIEECIK